MEPSASRLASALVAFVTRTLGALVERHAPEFVLPRVFAGHPVGSDAAADLAWTLVQLRAAGVEAVAGHGVDDAIATALAQVEGRATHSFAACHVAETLLAYGPFAANALVARFDREARANLAEACDTSAMIARLDTLPPNYVAVLARAELARARLGLLPAVNELGRLTQRTAALLAANPRGFIDDASDGSGRYDIYTADVYLFAEPLAPSLGPVWAQGVRRVLALLESTCADNGAAIPWGRSSGALAAALTIEYAALALTGAFGADRAAWAGRAVAALDGFHGWFSQGVVSAHQNRATYAYRGPHRRLQMGLDLLGKLAWSAAQLRRPHAAGAASASAPAAAWYDAWLPLDDAGAGVWCVRSPRLGFVLPAVGGRTSDYLPAPRAPGLFEVPVDSDHGVFVPIAYVGERRYAPAGRPRAVRHGPGALELQHGEFLPLGRFGSPPAPPLRAARQARYRVSGRRLEVQERLRFEQPPAALALVVPEIAGRPLRVTFHCDRPHRVNRIDVGGVAEWRSYWSEFAAVHQVEIEPATEVDLRWSVEPMLRVGLASATQPYVRLLYEPLGDRVMQVNSITTPSRLDIFHQHWPEWCHTGGDELGWHLRTLRDLRRAGVRILWTLHNLTPHAKQPQRYDPIYRAWAEAADTVLHHSEWGRQRALAELPFRADCRHVTLAHPHFGPLLPRPYPSRATAEAALGLPPCALRLGIVGAPRAEKDVAGFAAAFAASQRDDLGLCIWSLRPGEQVPDDRRIHAEAYRTVPRALYDLRLAACDVLVLPYRGHDMLGTGTAADAVAHGLPALVSDWPYLAEYLGSAGIPCGPDHESTVVALENLNHAALARAAAASRALQARLDPGTTAAATWEVLDQLASGRP